MAAVTTMRHQAIVDYVDQLHSGLHDLRHRALDIRAAYEAELSIINAEIARYELLIEDAKKQADDEALFVAQMEMKRALPASSNLNNNEIEVLLSSQGHQNTEAVKGRSKSSVLQAAALRVIREEGRPVKRGELARRLQLAGYLLDSENPVDLLRKALNNHDVLNFDVKRGYYID